MPTNARLLVNYRAPADLPKDAVTNTLYFQWDTLTVVDMQNLVDDLYAIYAARSWLAGARLEIRAYDMADAEPRPIKAQKVGQITGTIPWGNREPAICLSYYGERNLPRQRGRIYCGPFSSGSQDARPPATTINEIRTMGIALGNLGGENVSWRVHSPTTGEYHHIRHIWVDNAWDTVRKRGLAATSRVTADV